MRKPKSNLRESNKIPVTFNDEQWKYIQEYKGILGNKRAEIIRNIVLNWILNKSSFKKRGENNENKK